MRILWGLTLVLATATLAGCNTLAPIENVSSATVVGPAGKSLNAQLNRSITAQLAAS